MTASSSTFRLFASVLATISSEISQRAHVPSQTVTVTLSQVEYRPINLEFALQISVSKHQHNMK